jgi:murein hydrolase activator
MDLALKPAMKCAAALIACSLLLSVQAIAQDATPQELEAVQEQQVLATEVLARLKREVAERLTAEEELAQKLRDVAAEYDGNRRAYAKAETALQILKQEQILIRSDLSARRELLGEVLAGLQRLEENPPPALVVEPDDVLKALRGAMMFGAIVPELKDEAIALTRKLERLKAVHAETEVQRSTANLELASLGTNKRKLDLLAKEKLRARRMSEKSLAAAQSRSEELANKATSLKQLLDALAEDKRQAEARRIAEEQRTEELKRQEAEQRRVAQEKRVVEEQRQIAEEQRRIAEEQRIAEDERRSQQDRQAAEAKRRIAEQEQNRAEAERRQAEETRKAEDQRVAEQQRLATVANASAKAVADEETRLATRAARPPLRMKDAKGRLEYPVEGQIIRKFGEDNGFGSPMGGIAITTDKNALVRSPVDGTVEFAGNFRSFGKMVIINAGQEYLILLAGLGDISSVQGQSIRRGDPLGFMGDSRASVALLDTAPKTGVGGQNPLLYLEFRHNSLAIDSTPWWNGHRKEAQNDKE